ncbi:hypothetical protein SAY87_000521 [Trapa incisa]|uniref:Nucleolar protein 10 n=1 Tax=Trapa incisa TaxID=236973 RepID=A0AAN7GBU1_9MYRT|nr:hypothetical protein SAY87_000521 [Trapa incisa]
MYLQFYINENGDKVYTTKKESPIGLATQSAHPARFSPDDKYSRQRVLLKKRFGLLPTQQPPQNGIFSDVDGSELDGHDVDGSELDGHDVDGSELDGHDVVNLLY